jgi:hypothetical protein
MDLNPNTSIQKFINKVILENPTNPIMNIYTFLVQNDIKQNVIIYYFKKKIFLHHDLDRITQALIALSKHQLHAIMFINSLTLTNHYEVLYNILLIFIKLGVPQNLIKEPIFSFMNKTKLITTDLRNIIPYLEIINLFPDKICFAINLLVDLSHQNKLTQETIQIIVDMKKGNHKNNFIYKTLLPKFETTVVTETN